MSNISLVKNSTDATASNSQKAESTVEIAGLFQRAAQLEQDGHFDDAWHCYHAANQKKWAQLTWDDELEQLAYAEVVAIFTKEFIEGNELRYQNAGKTPVFIVGMPRSGSTLIEQILDMHPDINGMGEMPFLQESITSVMPNEADFPLRLQNIARRDLVKMRLRYMQKTMDAGYRAPFVVDKMLANFYYIGIIKMLWPHAKIIYAKRDKLDCCLSCYSKLFNQDNLGFTYDLAILNNYYRRHADLMHHWHSVLPEASIHTVEYGKTVMDIECVVQELLDYLGLAWHPACLRFHENTREVKTASKNQVNKPLYTSSIGRAAPFKKYLSVLDN